MSGFGMCLANAIQVQEERKNWKEKIWTKPQPPEGLWTFYANPYVVFALFLDALHDFLTSACKLWYASIALSFLQV